MILADQISARFAAYGPDVEPLDPGFAAVPPAERKAYFRQLGLEMRDRKYAELRKGIDVNGAKMPRRKRPRRDGATGPVLSPHWSDSRFRTQLRWDGQTDRAVLWWLKPWAKVVSAHARGRVRGAPVRDVIGLTSASMATAVDRARKWYDARQAKRREAALGQPPAPAVRRVVEDPARVAAQARAIFGRRVGLSDLASLGGAGRGAVADIRVVGQAIEVQVFGPGYRAVRQVYRSAADGRIVVRNLGSDVDRPQQRRGLARELLRREIETAQRLGASEIRAEAARGGDLAGYYVWPRMGFDAPIPADLRAILPPGLRRARTLLDLMETEVGREWWREHGRTINVVFDLTRGSRSLAAWRSYRAERDPAVEIRPVVTMIPGTRELVSRAKSGFGPLREAMGLPPLPPMGGSVLPARLATRLPMVRPPVLSREVESDELLLRVLDLFDAAAAGRVNRGVLQTALRQLQREHTTATLRWLADRLGIRPVPSDRAEVVELLRRTFLDRLEEAQRLLGRRVG